MGWQLGLLEAAGDLEITHEEVTTLVSNVVYYAIQSMVIVSILMMFVKGFYDILGPKKYAEQREEMIEMVEEIL